MRCLRVYAAPDGESYVGEIDIPVTQRSIFPNSAPFELSAHIRHSTSASPACPSGMREVALHTVPERAHRAARWRRRVRDERWRGAVRSGRRLRAGGGHARQGPHLPPFRRGADRPLDHAAERPRSPGHIVCSSPNKPRHSSQAWRTGVACGPEAGFRRDA